MVAVLDFLSVDPEEARNTLYTNMSDMFGKLAEPITPLPGSQEKMNNIVQIITELTEPKNDYSVYMRARKTCPEVVRVARARESRVMDENMMDVWRLFEPDDVSGDAEEHWKVELGGLCEDEQEDSYNELIPNCECHGPCPCCCSGCYTYHHLDKGLDLEFLLGQDLHEKESHPADVRPRFKGILKKSRGVMPSTDDQGRPKIEMIDDDDDLIVNGDAQRSSERKQNLPVLNLLENENGWKELCSHCCCQCNMKHYTDIVEPDKTDYEAFAIKFLEQLLINTPDSLRYCFKAGETIASSGSDLLLKQKVLEIGLPTFLRLMKEMRVNTQLYIVHFVFKLTVSMVVNRKYCFRDPEFFEVIARMLMVIDPCKNRDPNQLRIDSSHILYCALMGCGREYFVRVSRTRAFEYLIDQLQLVPQNDRDAQSAEDAFGCLMLFTDEWDLFIRKFQRTPMNKLIDKWRRYALEYADFLPRFIWQLETLKKRLMCCYQAHRVGRTDFRLDKTFDPDKLQEHSIIYCSNPACYKMNITSYGEGRYKKCSRCQIAFYCTKDCQLAHWKTHKKHCTKPSFGDEEEKAGTKKGFVKVTTDKDGALSHLPLHGKEVKYDISVMDTIDGYQAHHHKSHKKEQSKMKIMKEKFPKEHDEQEQPCFDSFEEILNSLYGK